MEQTEIQRPKKRDKINFPLGIDLVLNKEGDDYNIINKEIEE